MDTLKTLTDHQGNGTSWMFKVLKGGRKNMEDEEQFGQQTTL